MPLFFIIAIAAGGIAVGATAVDVTQDSREARMHAATFDPSPYATAADCQAAASRAGAPASACNGKI